MSKEISFLLHLLTLTFSVEGFEVKLRHNGPVVLGNTIEFSAEVSKALYDKFRYVWGDSAIKERHQGTFYGDAKYQWNITYPKDIYHPGKYFMELDVCESNIVGYWPCEKATVSYNITEDLNGEFQILQNNSVKYTPFVSNTTEVEHRIILKDTDAKFLEEHNLTTVTFWLINCTFLGTRPDLTFRFNYTQADEDVTVKAIVVTTQEKGNESIIALEEGPQSPLQLQLPGTQDGGYYTPWPDGSCNDSFIPKDPDKYYGYFHQVVKPRRPLTILSKSGNNWLENGDLLNYTVYFSGSQPYYHCLQFIVGEYNATGNESCLHTLKTSSSKINVIHYFGTGDKHTVLFIIENQVSKTVTPVIVTNYIAKKHPQLSVIVVPISCSAIAIILIVFGVAFYIQSKKRYVVEVADFDFSANPESEYKSFGERLREAINSAFVRRVSDEESEERGSVSSTSQSNAHHWSPSRNIPNNKPHQFENSDSDTQEN